MKKDEPVFARTPNQYVSGNKGITARDYAAIKLCIPNTGVEWLDDMIRQSLRDKFIAHALEGLCAAVTGGTSSIGIAAVEIADQAMKARDQ